jgi:puromycin-sensitive aminopeptidase
VGSGSEVKTVSVVLDAKSATFTVAVTGEEWWVKANSETSGFYRVNYGEDLLKRLTTASLASPVDRLSLQNDIYALAQAGASSTAAFLTIAAGYRAETVYSIWADLSGSLATLLDLYQLEGLPHAEPMCHYLRWLYGPVVLSLGWEAQPTDDATTPLLRALVHGMAAKARDPVVIAEALKRFAAHVSGEQEISVDMRGVVFGIVAGAGGEKEYEQLLAIYRTSDMQEEKVKALQALGGTKDAALLARSLTFAMSDEVRSQDTIYLVAAVSRNPLGRAHAWAWMQGNWEVIAAKFGGGQFMLSNFVTVVCGGWGSERRLAEVTDFFAGREVPGAEMALRQSLEKIKLQAAWMTRDGPTTLTFLQQHAKL